MTFISRPGMGGVVEAHRQLQHMLEESGQHRLPAPMGEPVGMQRDRDAAHDGEQRRNPTQAAISAEQVRPRGRGARAGIARRAHR